MMKRRTVLVTCLVLCLTLLSSIGVGAREAYTVPSVALSYENMYVKGDGSLWSFDDEGNSKKLLDDVVYAGNGVYGMNFFAIQSDGTLWSMNVNYQDEFKKTMSSVASTVSTSFQDFANFAVTKDGELYSWGRTGSAPDENCMGFADYDGSSISVENARLIMDGVDSVAAHTFNVAAVKTDGTLWRWGLGQQAPKKIKDEVESIVEITPDTIYMKNYDGSVGAYYYDKNDKAFFMTPSLFESIKNIDFCEYGGAYVKTDGSLWLGTITKDLGETHFGETLKNGVEDVFLSTSVIGKEEIVPVFAIKEDHSLWYNSTFSPYNEKIPYEEDFAKVMDNVESITGFSGRYAVVTVDGQLYTFTVGISLKIENLKKIADLSDLAPSDWAVGEIDTAKGMGIVPENMQKDYKTNISRADFCEMLVKTLEAKSDKNIQAIVNENAKFESKDFIDTDSEYVDYMYRLGIVNGISDTLFDPYARISREAAAVMLARAASVLGYDTSYSVEVESSVSSWAKDGVGFVTENGIMNGTGNGFEPQGKYTKEQAIATFVRLCNNLK